ncbi:hypothetical protein ACSFB8_07610 [Enterococcus faecalis]
MILDTIHYQRKIIRKIYFTAKRSNFSENVKLETLDKNKAKLLYFLQELENQKFLVIVNRLSNGEAPHSRFFMGGQVYIAPYWVKLTEKGQYFFPLLINTYLEFFLKSVLVPIIVSIATVFATNYFIK